MRWRSGCATCRSSRSTQAPALVPFNTTYWQGWPTADNPWNMPVSWWATFNLVVNGYPNAQTAAGCQASRPYWPLMPKREFRTPSLARRRGSRGAVRKRP